MQIIVLLVHGYDSLGRNPKQERILSYIGDGDEKKSGESSSASVHEFFRFFTKNRFSWGAFNRQRVYNVTFSLELSPVLVRSARFTYETMRSR